MTDFFDKRSAKTRLYEWLKVEKHALSHEIIAWGQRHNCNWPMRRLHELTTEGKVRRMPDEKRINFYGNGREQAWEIIGFTDIPVTQLTRTRRG